MTKEPFPDNPPTMDLKTELSDFATLLHDFKRYSSGSMLIKLAGSHCDVSQDGERIGAIGMSGDTLYVEVGDRLWRLDLESLFQWVVDAEQEQYLIAPDAR